MMKKKAFSKIPRDEPEQLKNWHRDWKVNLIEETNPDWRDLALPRPVLLSLPGLWRGDALQAAPLVCTDENWHPQLIRDENAFFATFLAH